MIPLRLVLKDFLSYGTPEPLDLSTFDIACLSGDNGAGKTALLDAITWASFGSARGCEGGQNQDRLIRDGADEAFVEFTFALAGVTYRIVRRRGRNAKAELHFLVADGDGWSNIAAETLKQTEAKIGSVLRMDYKTFTASAFFLQGRSEDFLARMNPHERKDVFARLLDLGTYERLEEAARAKAREVDAQRKELARRIEELAGSVPDVQNIENELGGVEQQISEGEEAVERSRDQARVAREALAELETAATLLAREREQTTVSGESLLRSRRLLETRSRELAAIDELVARREEVAQALREMDELSAADERASAQQEQAGALERRCAELTARVGAEQRRLGDRIAASKTTILSLEAERAALGELREELAKVDSVLASGTELGASLDAARAEHTEHEVTAARSEEHLRSLDQTITKATKSLEVLAGGGGECPVCGNALDRTHRAEAKRRLDAEIRGAKADVRAAKAAFDTARKEVARVAEEIKRMDLTRREHERLVAMREGLASKLERSAIVEDELTQLSSDLSADETQLREESFCLDLRSELLRLRSEISDLYDAKAHDKIRDRLKHLKPYATLAGRIEEASARRGALALEIADAEQQIVAIEAAIEEHRGRIGDLEARVAGLPDARRRVVKTERDLDEAQTIVSASRSSAARLQERLDGARRLRGELDNARQAERVAATTNRRYRRLTEAFGRGGIPDRIIDNALPELEEDANRILGALSDHEMSVRFVLQRETKSGKAKETFEALVHHEGAVRDFSMFSGGEAFRVAFAVRLAMSKLLVRRAGARLETLVIDEGFGTQDPVGRERLVEAINLARTEFARVLVITHLDELKDQFGTQIRVEKGTDGSVFSIEPG